MQHATIDAIESDTLDDDVDHWADELTGHTNTRLQHSDELIGIAEMCDAFQVSPRTLRFYEEKGLLTPRRINGTRVYSKQDRARLARILRAKSLGTPLSEIKAYLDMYGQHGEGRIQQLIYAIEKTDAAIKELEEKRAQIDASLAEMRLINATSRQALAKKRGETTER
ncbi:MAG: MerR family DNA-binding transcriptional regulator [Burkholderiales bacterium]|nr:MerR family DNA-binding transcriptional regulator [Burkholderiales bacterium]